MDMQQKHAAWIGMEGAAWYSWAGDRATWTDRMDMKQGFTAWTCSKYMQHGHAASTMFLVKIMKKLRFL
jgi:hypothetical protein